MAAAKAPATPATLALTAAGIGFGVHQYSHDPGSDLSFGLEAAAALGVDPAAVFKTLMVRVSGLTRHGGLTVALVPVAESLDLKAVARALGQKKAALASPADAQRSSGYVTGGISPVGQRTPLPTLIDESAETLHAVYVSGGRRGFDVSLAPADLVSITDARFAPIAAIHPAGR
ncbi:Cys-tRNA(Pro) deacylase [Ruania zhangjianzhongii]|uniref:Cys-tRNA(Pro) deacylase n=1 Tax=Ruania zhangjianzhongii TaxID=2603206 RepID=UPI0011CC4764|nr:Cys-tRNA(Pro) deacylase [Ruania zhangjianzhongii]